MARLSALSGGVFAEATRHTPVDVTEKALAAYEASAADCVVARLAAARPPVSARRSRLDRRQPGGDPDDLCRLGNDGHLGETAGGEKTTRRDPPILPETVIYDVDLTLMLPPAP